MTVIWLFALLLIMDTHFVEYLAASRTRCLFLSAILSFHLLIPPVGTILSNTAFPFNHYAFRAHWPFPFGGVETPQEVDLFGPFRIKLLRADPLLQRRIEPSK